MRFFIPVTIVEYGRLAVVEAKSKKEALEIYRSRGWDECTDATNFKVTKVGAVQSEEELDARER